MPSLLIVPVGPNRNGPFHLISNRNFQNFGLNVKCPRAQTFYFCERFEPRSQFISRLGWVWSSRWTTSWIGLRALDRTVIVDRDSRFDNLCGSHLQSQTELYHVSWWYSTLYSDLIGQLSGDVFCHLSLKP